MSFLCAEHEYDQIRLAVMGAFHPKINTILSETVMPARRPIYVIQFQPMCNFFNAIEVPKHMQRSPPVGASQNVGALADATRNWFGSHRFHNSNIFFRCAFYVPRKTALMEKFAKEREISTMRYCGENCREAKSNLSSEAFMARKRAVQQLEPNDKKRHDGKVEKLIATALQRHDACFRFDFPGPFD